MRRTKIVCTIGPAVASKEAIGKLIQAGMNVARLNCSHGNWEDKRQWIEWIRELSSDVAPVGILADLQGPKFRLGEITSGSIELGIGEEVIVGPSARASIPIQQQEILDVMAPGDRILLGDGDVELHLNSESEGHFFATTRTGGVVKSRQGVTLIDKSFDVPAMTPKDCEDLSEALKCGVDFIALSYVRHGCDIVQLRDKVNKVNPAVKLCAKIETRDAIDELDSIICASDVIMVARGDMGLQMHIEDVPLAQKKIIRACQSAGKPVITATQMLESMVHNARPTRAEATDVANAILDGTDAVMLSGETAAGAYPFDAVAYMARIAEKAESVYNHHAVLHRFGDKLDKSVDHTEAVAFAVAQMAIVTEPTAILTTSTSGQTPRLVSKYRPEAPIWCATWNDATYRQMSIVWGVEAVKVPLLKSADDINRTVIGVFKEKGRLAAGDQVIITSGMPVGVAGATNLILTETVRDDTEVSL